MDWVRKLEYVVNIIKPTTYICLHTMLSDMSYNRTRLKMCVKSLIYVTSQRSVILLAFIFRFNSML